MKRLIILGFSLIIDNALGKTRPDVRINESTVIVNDVTCEISVDYKAIPRLLEVDVVGSIVLVNYSQEAANGTSCLTVAHRTVVVDIKNKKCKGDYLRKLVDISNSCDSIDQPVWQIDKDKIIIKDAKDGINQKIDIDYI